MAEDPATAIEIPYRELSAAALRGVIEAWVLREGTDYGEQAYTLEEKLGAVLAQLERGDALIVFEPASRTTAIVPAVRTRRAR